MKLRVAGINFHHMHMGDLLRMVFDHPEAEIVGVCDAKPARMSTATRNFGITEEQVFTDVDACIERTRPDLVILCPATARHAEYVERVARHRVHILLEKPFAASVGDADRMIATARKNKVLLAINWPLRWFPSHCTAYRLLNDGLIGDLTQVHYYGGNRGPLWHAADKVETTPTPAMKRASWFYKKAQGGGSLLDYLGYGATLGTWYHHGAKPIEVMSMVDRPKGLEVDEHSVTVARYRCGLSKFETLWGTFTDPWKHPTQPRSGFVLKGQRGTIASDDYARTVRVQTEAKPDGVEVPVDTLKTPFVNPVQYMVHCLQTGSPVEGPLSPTIARIGQQIVDTAFKSAQMKMALPLVTE